MAFTSSPRGKAGKARFARTDCKDLRRFPASETALAAVRNLPSAGYTEAEWKYVKACFTLLRRAAGELQIVFAEAGAVDFTEVAQIAQRVLQDENKLPTETAMGVSDNIRHLLVDEFQDTSRRQHQLLSTLVAAWPEPAGRTCFVVGDPMQSIYFFREADAELFARVQSIGLELADGERHKLGDVRLTANFRTAPELVAALNETFHAAFAEDDESGIRFGASGTGATGGKFNRRLHQAAHGVHSATAPIP